MHGGRFVSSGGTATHRAAGSSPHALAFHDERRHDERVGGALRRALRHDSVAVVDAHSGTETTGNELLRLADDAAAALDLPPSSLVALTGSNSAEFIATYVGLHLHGHVVIMTSAHFGEVAEKWGCDASVSITDAGATTDHLRQQRQGANLHPDLAMLMTTSGSTGAPKLVRLSHRNVLSNSDSIRAYLGISPSDRAITTLPATYCYGLSVLHSHLLAGASIAVADYSVADPCFASAVDRHSVTNFAGVPYTFELLDNVGFDVREHPGIRFVTQAGGHLDPERVRTWALATRAIGADLFVMYGQTEATARMAYLPPELTVEHPGAIGIPIPGGTIRIAHNDVAECSRIDGDDGDDGSGAHGVSGEIIYSGDNVMMGYACTSADLALGPELTELRTGDLGYIDPTSGLIHVTGRAARFVKPFGVRVDLDALHDRLAADHASVAVAGDDDIGIVVAVPRSSVPDAAQRSDAASKSAETIAIELAGAVAARTGLPFTKIHALAVDAVPRTESGKPDGPTLVELARQQSERQEASRAATTETERDSQSEHAVRELYATVFGLSLDEIGSEQSFVDLGGDSLRYVETSVRLEALLGDVPADWHLQPVRHLEALRERRAAVGDKPRRFIASIDTTLVLRAVAILAVVATHMRIYRFPGGAHLMLAVSGYNVARFHAARDSSRDIARSGVRTAARAGLPATLWIGLNMVIAGGYSLGALGLVNNYFGSPWRTEGRWRYWYFDVFVQLTLAVTVLLLVPAVRRMERRAPYLFALGLLATTLVFRYDLVVLGDDYNAVYRTHVIAWFFVLGWLIVRSLTTAQRVLTSALIVATIPGFFDRPQREWFIVAGLLLLTWIPTLKVPRLLVAPIATVAAASLWILLVHWQLWPALDSFLLREWAYVGTIAGCVAVWWLVERGYGRLSKSIKLLVSHRSPPRSET